MRQLAHPVVVHDGHRAVSFVPGDELPEWAAEQITNPFAWDDHPLNRLARAGATVEELAAFRSVWDGLSDEERGEAIDAEFGVDVDELREQLAGIRRAAGEHHVSVSEAIALAVAGIRDDEVDVHAADESADATPGPSAPDDADVALAVIDSEERKPLHRRTKDDLIVLAAEHDVTLEPDATKAQILEALQDAHIEA